MPTSKEEVKEFFQRITALETKVESLMTFQRWQTGLLAALILMAVKALLFN